MAASFVAYVDEAGDEGFKFRTSPAMQRSSDWFVLAAFVTRKQTDLETVKLIDQVRREFELPPRKHVHWKDLKHPKKVRYAQLMAGLQARAIGVCVHKPSLLEPEKFQESYRLYFFAVRYLMERVSWLARDRHDTEKWGGDGTVDVLFSNRQGMPYDKMRDYLRHLQVQQASGQDVRIDFANVPPDRITTQTPGRSMGLQLADAAAGAFFNAIETDAFGNTEPRYLTTMSPILYRHQGMAHGYGLKLLPREASINLKDHAALQWLAGLK
ncbi:MAG: DUF3800 domain-containing protein [Planctomycetota bacterium]|nr:DUF3800 domain-containing protein [Planctomycetota bacterium]